MPRGFRSVAGLSRTAPPTLALPLFDPLPRWGASLEAGGERVSAHLHPRSDAAVSPSPARPCPDHPIDAAASCPAACRARPRAGRLAARGKALRALAGCTPRMPPARPALQARKKGNSRDAGRFRRVWPSAWRLSARRAPGALRSGRVGRPEEHPRRRRDPGARPRAGQLRAQPRHVMTPAAAFAERKERGGINGQTAEMQGVATMRLVRPQAEPATAGRR